MVVFAGCRREGPEPGGAAQPTQQQQGRGRAAAGAQVPQRWPPGGALHSCHTFVTLLSHLCRTGVTLPCLCRMHWGDS
eukprot:3798707-Pyramimonas_sp.AAC.2